MKYLEDYQTSDFNDSFLERNQIMNPEKLLEEVAATIKHRTISTTFKWYIVYYYDRITCVPTYVNVPDEIIMATFTEKMVQDGFTPLQWGTLKQNIVEIYKELHK